MSNSLIVLFLLSIVFIYGGCEDEDELPQMYKMESYKKCKKDGGLWCLYNFKITARDTSLEIWSEIEESQHDEFKMDRSFIHRMICLPRNEQNRSGYVKKVMESELYGKNLTVEMIGSDCYKNWLKPPIWMLVSIPVTLYIAIIVISTCSHGNHLNDPYWPKTTYEKLCEMFSLIKNYQKLTQNNTSGDFQRLKGIQGMRVITIAAIVAFHSIVGMFHLYVDNVDQLEKVYKNPLLFFEMMFGGFAVQIFFLISPTLLTNQIMGLHSQHEQFTLEHCFILVLNRYFRFVPTLLVMIAIARLGFFNMSPHMVGVVNSPAKSCSRYSWHTLLQVNFLVPKASDICIGPMWYLSVDTLYYVTTIVVLYITLKLHLDIKKISALMFVGLCVGFGFYIHTVDENDFWYRPYPQIVKMDGDFPIKVYTPPLASWSTSCMGVFLGYIYYRYKKTIDIKITWKLNTVWLLTVISLPLVILYVASRSYEGIAKIILAATLKPMFVLPICLGFLGMAFGFGGVLKAFLESKILVILANVSYCTYVFHIFVLGVKGLFSFGILHYEPQYMAIWIIFDIVVSFAFGTVCTLLFEYPGLALQKKYLPQIKKPKKIEKKIEVNGNNPV